MKFFVSGKIGDETTAQQVMNALKDAGHTISFDWTSIRHLKPYDQNVSESREAAVLEARAVKDADVLVVAAHDKGVGMYVELGIAIGAGVPVRVISADVSRTMFFHHPLVRIVNAVDEIIAEYGRSSQG